MTKQSSQNPIYYLVNLKFGFGSTNSLKGLWLSFPCIILGKAFTKVESNFDIMHQTTVEAAFKPALELSTWISESR